MKKVLDFLNKAWQPLLLILMVFLVMVACGKGIKAATPQEKNVESKETPNNVFTEMGKVGADPFSDYNVVKAYTLEATDGCTYIVVTSYSCDSRGGSSVAIRHSAACPNEIHDALRVE